MAGTQPSAIEITEVDRAAVRKWIGTLPCNVVLQPTEEQALLEIVATHRLDAFQEGYNTLTRDNLHSLM